MKGRVFYIREEVCLKGSCFETKRYMHRSIVSTTEGYIVRSIKHGERKRRQNTIQAIDVVGWPPIVTNSQYQKLSRIIDDFHICISHVDMRANDSLVVIVCLHFYAKQMNAQANPEHVIPCDT